MAETETKAEILPPNFPPRKHTEYDSPDGDIRLLLEVGGKPVMVEISSGARTFLKEHDTEYWDHARSMANRILNAMLDYKKEIIR